MEQTETNVTPPAPPSAPSAPPPRAMRWLLIASLALNLLIVGVVAGGLIRGGRYGPPRGVDLQLGPVVQALSPDDRQAIRADLRGREELRQNPWRERDAMLAEMLQLLRTDPFDPAGIDGLLRDQRERGQAVQTAAQEALMARIGLMSPADRGDFADRLEAELSRGGEGRGDRD